MPLPMMSEWFQFIKTLLYVWPKSISSYVYTIICGNLEALAGAGTMGLCGPTYMIGIWGDSRSAHRCQSPIANRDHGQKT